MNSENFVYWLDGLLENTTIENLTKEKLDLIKTKLRMISLKDIKITCPDSFSSEVKTRLSDKFRYIPNMSFGLPMGT